MSQQRADENMAVKIDNAQSLVTIDLAQYKTTIGTVIETTARIVVKTLEVLISREGSVIVTFGSSDFKWPACYAD